MELVYIFVALIALALAFLRINRAQSVGWRFLGPWLVVLGVCTGIMIAFPPTRERYTWAAVTRANFLDDLLGGFGFLFSFGIVAVVMSRLCLRFTTSLLGFVPSFVGTTLLAWIVVFLVWTAAMPGS